MVDGSWRSKRPNGISEIWYELPKQLEPFLAVLNGMSMTYDYALLLKHAGFSELGAGVEPPQRSWLFSVSAENLGSGADSAVIPGLSGASMPLAEVDAPGGRDCGWIAEPLANAIQFTSNTSRVQIVNPALIAGDLTLEAWVNPPVDGNRGDTILHCSQPNGPNFRLGVDFSLQRAATN